MPELPPGPIELPRSGIRIEGDTLIKTDEAGEVVGRLRLGDIREVEMIPEWPRTWVAILCVLLCVEAVFYWLEAGWLGLGAWVLLLLCAAGVLAFMRTVVRIRSGPAEMRWVIRDPRKECRKFVASLRSMIGGKRGGQGSSA